MSICGTNNVQNSIKQRRSRSVARQQLFFLSACCQCLLGLQRSIDDHRHIPVTHRQPFLTTLLQLKTYSHYIEHPLHLLLDQIGHTGEFIVMQYHSPEGAKHNINHFTVTHTLCLKKHPMTFGHNFCEF